MSITEDHKPDLPHERARHPYPYPYPYPYPQRCPYRPILTLAPPFALTWILLTYTQL